MSPLEPVSTCEALVFFRPVGALVQNWHKVDPLMPGYGLAALSVSALGAKADIPTPLSNVH